MMETILHVLIDILMSIAGTNNRINREKSRCTRGINKSLLYLNICACSVDTYKQHAALFADFNARRRVNSLNKWKANI